MYKRQIIGLITNPIIIAIIVISILVPVVFYKRRVSNYTLDLDNFSEPEEIIEYEDEETEEYIDDYDIEEDLPDAFSNEFDEEDEFEEEIPRKVSKKVVSQQPIEQKSKKRKVTVTTNQNSEGPITKTKRKKLSSVIADDETQVMAKRKTVKKSADNAEVKKKTVKKKVETELQDLTEKESDNSILEVNSQEQESVKKKERRKPVRRKSKSNEKIIDEDSLQDNLLDEFIEE